MPSGQITSTSCLDPHIPDNQRCHATHVVEKLRESEQNTGYYYSSSLLITLIMEAVVFSESSENIHQTTR